LVAFVAVVSLAACNAVPAPPPPTLGEYVQGRGATFAAAEAPPGELLRDGAIAIVRGARGLHHPFLPETPLDAVYGIITCPDTATCRDSFKTFDDSVRIRVWVVRSLAQVGPDAGHWVMLNAETQSFSVQQ